MPQVAEIYLKCLKCGRIPEMERTEGKNAAGQIVLKYELKTNCLHCGSGEFEVIEVRSKG